VNTDSWAGLILGFWLAVMFIALVQAFNNTGESELERLEDINYSLEMKVEELEYEMEDMYTADEVSRHCYNLADGYYSERLCEWLTSELD